MSGVVGLCLASCAAALLALTTACSVGPHYRRPGVQTPSAFKEAPGNDQWKTATPSDGELRGDWWELFHDPDLSELERMVAVSNQNVKQAEAQFRQARAAVRLNRADYLPTVSASLAITHSYTSANLTASRNRLTTQVTGPGAASGSFTLYSAPLSVSWEPDLWGRVGLEVQNAAATAQAGAADLENMKLSMQAELAADYFQLAGLDMQERLLTDTIEAYQRALQLTLNRFNGGVASKADVVQAQTQLERTQAQRTDLGIARSQFEHAIAVLTGRPPSELSLTTRQIAGPPPAVPGDVPSQLLERRPDIAAAERLTAAANARIGLARVAYFPTVALTGGFGLQSGSVGNWLSWPSRFWSVGPNVAQTLFDFGRRRAQNDQAQAAFDAAVAGYRQTTLNAFQEVEDQLAAMRQLAQEATEQEAAVHDAQEALRLELDRYKAGTVSYLDVITNQTIALQSEITAVGILERRMTVTVQLIRALGGGWHTSQLPTGAALRQ